MEWQPIEDYAGMYEVSQRGDVRHKSGKVLGSWPNDQGYMIVRLNHPRALLRVHRLVAAAFLPNPEALPVVNHIDSDRANNRVDNLEWCTQKQNLAHATTNARMPRNYGQNKRSPNARLDDDQVRSIRAQYEQGNDSWSDLGAKFGISKRSIGRIVRKESYPDV